MRKILSKEQEQKKNRRKQFVIGGMMVLIMLASVLGYAFTKEQTGNNPKIVYNGFEFAQVSGFWNVAIGNSQFSFKYNPTEINKVTSTLNLLSSYSGKPLYVYSENKEAETEIYKNLFYQNQIVQRFQDACITGEICADNVPVKTCQDNLIIIKENSVSSIKQDNNCVFIEGNQENLTKLSDSFLFRIIGVQ